MNKPYGFKIVANIEKAFMFTERDWGLLTVQDEFTYMSGQFKKMIGLDALEFMVGKPRYPVHIMRTKRFFIQLAEQVGECFVDEMDDLCTDYKVLIAGVSSPLSTLHCNYMGFSATATGRQGFCSLRAYDGVSRGTSREVVKVDLRRFKEFPVDDDQTIRLKTKKRESYIQESISDLISFVHSKSVGDSFKVELTGGDH